jgi:catechol-2,3-dioxygenase
MTDAKPSDSRAAIALPAALRLGAVGFNVWNGQGVGPAPAGTVGLHHWRVQLPMPDDVAVVRGRADRARVPR